MASQPSKYWFNPKPMAISKKHIIHQLLTKETIKREIRANPPPPATNTIFEQSIGAGAAALFTFTASSEKADFYVLFTTCSTLPEHLGIGYNFFEEG